MAPEDELFSKLVTGMAADPKHLFFCVHQNVGLSSVVYRWLMPFMKMALKSNLLHNEM